MDVVFISVMVAAGGGFLAAAGLANSQGQVTLLPGHPDRGLVLVSGVILTLAGTVIAAVRNIHKAATNAEWNALKQRVRGADSALDKLSALEITVLFDHLKCSTSERISLYMPGRDGTYLKLIGRHALTPAYNARGRERYPLDEGCLALAWREGEAVADDLPDPQFEEAAWQERLAVDWRIPHVTSATFRMKSRTCVALAIRSTALEPFRGVIVVESQLQLSADSTQVVVPLGRLKREMKRQYLERLVRLLDIHSQLDD